MNYDLSIDLKTAFPDIIPATRPSRTDEELKTLKSILIGWQALQQERDVLVLELLNH